MKNTRSKPRHVGKHRENVAGYIFLSPWLIGFFLFTIIPMLVSLYLSFTKYNVTSAPVWTGLENFIRMFTNDKRFLNSLGVTFYYAIASVLLRLSFALLVAVLLTQKIKCAGLFRAVYYLPSLIGGSVAIAIIWRNLFASSGVVNTLLQSIGIPIKISWLGSPYLAIWTLIIQQAWQFGSAMIIFAAGLTQIPATYHEAASLDGAGAWKRFTKITFPMLSPIILFNLVMGIINAFKSFTQAYIITKGGPLDSTMLYSLYIYKEAFEFFEMGYASALAWVLLIIVMIITALVFRSSNRWVFNESGEEGKG